ncbi:hypothetical protein NDU88_000942 [Pleurodeles waltl]|uniref:Uncharacterized protein n=1 Tax=Pleurodeles waltl TaxID=8319 RepID=A0AAV7WGX7_PLEWA|nr:hypothetical protein NDU88_000942 [Pleurodeles waltl]
MDQCCLVPCHASDSSVVIGLEPAGESQEEERRKAAEAERWNRDEQGRTGPVVGLLLTITAVADSIKAEQLVPEQLVQPEYLDTKQGESEVVS